MLKLLLTLALLASVPTPATPPAVDMWVDFKSLIWVTADPSVPVLTIEFYRGSEPFVVESAAASFGDCAVAGHVVTCEPTEAGVWMLIWVVLDVPPGTVVHGHAFSGARGATVDIAGPPASVYLPLIGR
jgi:hypothetical protein